MDIHHESQNKQKLQEKWNSRWHDLISITPLGCFIYYIGILIIHLVKSLILIYNTWIKTHLSYIVHESGLGRFLSLAYMYVVTVMDKPILFYDIRCWTFIIWDPNCEQKAPVPHNDHINRQKNATSCSLRNLFFWCELQVANQKTSWSFFVNLFKTWYRGNRVLWL